MCHEFDNCRLQHLCRVQALSLGWFLLSLVFHHTFSVNFHGELHTTQHRCFWEPMLPTADAAVTQFRSSRLNMLRVKYDKKAKTHLSVEQRLSAGLIELVAKQERQITALTNDSFYRFNCMQHATYYYLVCENKWITFPLYSYLKTWYFELHCR